MSIYGVTDAPVSNFWWCLLWVLKPEWAALFAFGRGVCYIHSLRFTSGATPLLVYMASIAAVCFPHMYVSIEVGCRTRTRLSRILCIWKWKYTEIKCQICCIWQKTGKTLTHRNASNCRIFERHPIQVDQRTAVCWLFVTVLSLLVACHTKTE